MNSTTLRRFLKTAFALFVPLSILVSCAILKPEKIYPGHFAETKLSFSDGLRFVTYGNLYQTIFSGRYSKSYFIASDEKSWFRDSTNIYQSYHTLKKLGLKNLITENQFFDTIPEVDGQEYYVFSSDFYGESLSSLLHKLQDSYQNPRDTVDYFTEFWMRRKAESNDKIVFYIVEDLLEIYEGKNPMAIDSSVINDTLYTLWDYNHRLLEADSTQVKQVTLENFEVMRSYGLDYSANNLITYSRFQLPEERDSLIRLMPHDSLEFYDHWGDVYQTQWVLDAPDYGP